MIYTQTEKLHEETERRGGNRSIEMGNQKLKWTAEEEEALLAGVRKHGPGKWKNILRDPEFAEQLSNRSNIDLKVLIIFFLNYLFLQMLLKYGKP